MRNKGQKVTTLLAKGRQEKHMIMREGRENKKTSSAFERKST